MKRVFGIPTLIAIASIIALVSGLVGDGAADAIAWIGLGVPIIAIAWALRYRSR